MTYQITFETEDGTIEEFCAEATKAAAIKMARTCAKTSAMNEPLHVVRWFVEKDGFTVSAYRVAA